MITQWINEALRGGNKVTIDYPDGGFLTAQKEKSAIIKYNTGDCIWLDYIDDEFQIWLIITCDDVRWSASRGLEFPEAGGRC
jgi:hypothetical protein